MIDTVLIGGTVETFIVYLGVPVPVITALTTTPHYATSTMGMFSPRAIFRIRLTDGFEYATASLAMPKIRCYHDAITDNVKSAPSSILRDTGRTV